MWNRQLFALGLVLLLSPLANGANNYWLNGDGNYTNASPWSLGVPPAGGDAPFFTNQSTYTVTLTAPAWTNWGVTWSWGNVTMDLGGNLLFTTNTLTSIGSTSAKNVNLLITNGMYRDQVKTIIGANNTFVSNQTVTIRDKGIYQTTNLLISAVGGFSSNCWMNVQDDGLLILNGPSMFHAIGATAQGYGNGLSVSGSGVITNLAGPLTIGQTSSNGFMYVTNGGTFYSAVTFNVGGIGSAKGSYNTMVVNGGNVFLAATPNIGNHVLSAGNTFIIENGGKVFIYPAGGLNVGNGSHNNSLIIRGADSMLTNNGNAGLLVGTASSTGTNSTLVCSNGAFISWPQNYTIGGSTGSWARAIYSDPGTTNLSTIAAGIIIGNVAGSSNNFAMVSNGAYCSSLQVSAGFARGSSNNVFIVTDPGSIATMNRLNVGTNGNGDCFGNSVMILNGGTLECTNVVTGPIGCGTVTNFGGILQFDIRIPVVTTGALNSVVCTNGIISFSGCTNVSMWQPAISNITFQGVSNTIRLVSSSNQISGGITRVFGTNNSDLYQHADFVNNGSQWRAPALVNGPGARMMFSNGVQTIFGDLTNSLSAVVVRGSTVSVTNIICTSSNWTLDLCPLGSCSITSTNWCWINGYAAVYNWIGPTNQAGTRGRIYSTVQPTSTMLSNFAWPELSLTGAAWLASGEIVPTNYPSAPSVVVTNFAPMLLIFD